MTPPLIHGSKPVFSASAILDAIASALTSIKTDDSLTDADLGAALGKSEDQAAKYRTGLATMDAITFARGKREWNGRFTGPYDRLCIDSRPSGDLDRHCQSKVLRVALALADALADDDEITPDEIDANRAVLEAGRDAIEALLRKAPAKPAYLREVGV